MIQFNQEQIANIKKRASQETIEAMIADNDVVLNNETLVPPDGRATWNLYYYCPEHGVRLNWNRQTPKAHRCPVDGKKFTGQPYDGAWWRWLNGLNAKACYDLGLLWHLTGNERFLSKVKEILLQSAFHYPDYEVHGGIPYNGPGKANAQTLCEANCHLDLARGYDFIRSDLTDEEQNFIETRLLREGAEFLMEHRTPQLHNHEMKINATIGVIGLILDDTKYIDFALNTEYGIHYQLNHGSTDEGMWFEGSIHYHYYALQALLNFEKIAYNTPFSVSSNPNFIKMLKFPLNLVLNTGDFPRLNDCIAGQEKLTHSHLFEFAYAQYPCDEFAGALTSIYKNKSRDNIDALLYGVSELPDACSLKCNSIHTENAGITIHHDQERNHTMLLKHSPYGGEHDHYDRLGLILVRNGIEVLPDLGTTGYGAELHYGYYKNSATHNTLVINQKNQPPINPKVLNYATCSDYTIIDTIVDWSEPEATVDSHTLVQWDTSAYQDIEFRRVMICVDEMYIEINDVLNPYLQQLDLTYHVRGLHKSFKELKKVKNPLTGPLERLSDPHLSQPCNHFTANYEIKTQSDFSQHFWFSSECRILQGYAPDNPAVDDLAYTLVRSKSEALGSVVLYDMSANSESSLTEVNWHGSTVDILIKNNQHTLRVSYDLASFTVDIVRNY